MVFVSNYFGPLTMLMFECHFYPESHHLRLDTTARWITGNSQFVGEKMMNNAYTSIEIRYNLSILCEVQHDE